MAEPAQPDTSGIDALADALTLIRSQFEPLKAGDSADQMALAGMADLGTPEATLRSFALLHTSEHLGLWAYERTTDPEELRRIAARVRLILEKMTELCAFFVRSDARRAALDPVAILDVMQAHVMEKGIEDWSD